MNTSRIRIENIEVDIIRKKIKNLNLRVRPPSGKVQISAPHRISDETLRLFIISKMSWIKKHQSRINISYRKPDYEFVSGETHYFKGRPYWLNVIYHDERPRAELRDDAFIDLYVELGSNCLEREKVMTEWYRSRLKEDVSLLVPKWGDITGITVANWGIKKMKTRWGSCNRKARRIWLNLELIEKPTQCLEFIIVHELSHILEPRHDENFYRLMDLFIPQWRSYQVDLNRSIPFHGDTRGPGNQELLIERDSR